MVSILGFDTDIALSGNEFLNRYSNNTYGLVLLDIMMPGLDGVETLKKFREIELDVDVIAVTANSYPEQIDYYKSVGFKDVVVKPIDINRLKDKLDLYK